MSEDRTAVLQATRGPAAGSTRIDASEESNRKAVVLAPIAAMSPAVAISAATATTPPPRAKASTSAATAAFSRRVEMPRASTIIASGCQNSQFVTQNES